jgi:pentatricopeptide repeat protein
MGPKDKVPAPLDEIIDLDLSLRTAIYECTLGRELGIEILPGDNSAVVGKVTKGSKAEACGINTGDRILATSATAGQSMWAHTSADGVKAALNTRFVMSSTVQVRFARPLEAIPETILSKLRVPYYYTVKLKRPIGLHVVEALDKGVYVQYIKPENGAARSKRIEVQDQLIAMSASWGDRMWDVNSVESFIVGVKMRTDPVLTLKLKRWVGFKEYSGHREVKMARTETKRRASSLLRKDENDFPRRESFMEQVESARTGKELLSLWKALRRGEFHAGGDKASCYTANKAMSCALTLESPAVAIEIFESSFNFSYEEEEVSELLGLARGDDEDVTLPAGVLSSAMSGSIEDTAGSGEVGSASFTFGALETLEPNNFVATTAIKAYGRVQDPTKALAILSWLEARGTEPDIFFMSALLFVLAKCKRVADAERIFWEEIPARNLKYTVATTNSLMYMYARLNRADDALRVYELTKSLGLQCTVVTYGVLIKALMRSNKKPLEQSAFEILESLPAMGITPGVEIFNQFFEHYARTRDFRQTKNVLKLMARSKPRLRPDAVTYGYLISCFAESRKPRSALKAFYQMCARGFKPDGYAYMGVLKALYHMRDGFTAAQVLVDMRKSGMTAPDKRHYSMAMFSCVVSGQNEIAESLYKMYERDALLEDEQPDTVLNTLMLRALLQQSRWTDVYSLVQRMEEGPKSARPNLYTYNYLLQFQMLEAHWQEGENTLAKIFQVAEGSKGALPSAMMQRDIWPEVSVGATQNVLRGTFQALSFALGPYSSRLQQLYKDDMLHSPIINQGSGPNNVLLQLDVGEPDEEGNLQKVEFGLKSTRKLQTFNKPTPEGLQFLVSSLESIAATESTISSDFYAELLKVVSLEGFLSEAERVLGIGKLGLLRSPRGIGPDRTEIDAKVASAEELAHRLIRQKLQDSDANARG